MYPVTLTGTNDDSLPTSFRNRQRLYQGKCDVSDIDIIPPGRGHCFAGLTCTIWSENRIVPDLC